MVFSEYTALSCDNVTSSTKDPFRWYTSSSSVGRTLEEFKTSVNIAAHKKVTFELTYEELMKRTHGKYELQIHARPMQPVKDFKLLYLISCQVDVYIHEKAGISFVDVKGGLSTKALANAITKTKADEQVWVHFYPTVDQQKVCDSCGEHGLNGDLIVVYDVSRDSGLGEIKTSDGYFIHHFAPASLPRISKNVVFVIDRSGSMQGTKMEQTRRALIHILNDLAEEDFFGLITFDDQIFHWKKELVQATSGNLQKAKTFAETIEARGATDINTAVLKGAEMLNAHPREDSASILILLTDGDPTSGETNIESIQSNVRRAIAGKFPLYCLGFGFDVNFNFLEKMSLQNNGVGRRIYEDSDADLQLTGFYEEVATPLLTDVTMIYLGGTNLTQTNFSQYYNGSEIVVAGQITDNNIETFIPQVVAVSRNGKMTFSKTKTSTVTPTGTVSEGLLQRVWAYLTVKQFLEKALLLSGAEKEKVKKEALELSLKYSFVTPHTSMVVTKPQGENTDVLHKPKEGERSSQDQQYHIGHGQTMKIPTRSELKNFSLTEPRFMIIIIIFNPIGGYPSHPGLHGFRGPPDYDLSYDDDLTMDLIPLRATFAPVSHRFVLKTENQSPSLCFDIHGEVLLKLLHDPSKELYVNGELDSVKNGGFKKIVIHVQTDLLVKVDTNEVTVHEGQAAARTVGEDPVTVGSLTVINRGNEIDIAVGDVRIVILVHGNYNKFLWPVLRQRPSADSTEGILALKPAVYQEVQQVPGTKLRINDQEIHVTSSSAVDYSTSSSAQIHCWLISADFVLQRPVNDFVVAKL
ncbi:inter-alpha-trypsin inhibitor heavy chain H3-like [Melanotaenia boesemani]|uniref:inter-alpha-trypsin inhibitor heavy chain H3-like n=1 Tax=Melanotaenia boesemani TaxID=1250792 RepID=UPI001C04CA33|nr:inter-alpha-trypsin inhibitor heavy chain H3-like [Melanotaenia boesemani]